MPRHTKVVHKIRPKGETNLKAFFKEKGLYLFCLAMVLAATVTGVLAVRTVVRNVSDLTKTRQQSLQEEENNLWNAPDAAINEPVTDLPQSTPAPSAKPSVLPSASGASGASEPPSAGAGGSAASSAPPAASLKQPVNGKPLQPFSGDELVYNATLGDWRTHNGADYALEKGAQVPAVKAGTVLGVSDGGVWGGVVEVSDRSGVLWRYCGVTASVQAGDKVTAGQSIGTLSGVAAEASLDSHLHLETTRDADYLDPETLK